MSVMNMFPGGSTLQIPLDAPTSFSATAGNAQVELTWTDPLDKYATPEGEVSETGDQLVSEWDHTVLVRKTGSQPAGPNDGTVVVSSSVRNQYQSTAYVDSGLTNDTTYYYGVFAYNKDGVASSGAFVNATPKAGTPLSELTEGTIIKINENGSPVEFYLAKHNYEPDLNGQGRELVVRKDGYGKGVWNTSLKNAYAGSKIDTWFNGDYKNILSPALQGMIGTTTFRYTPGNYDWDLATLSRSVFTLSVAELGRMGDASARGHANTEGSTLPIASTLLSLSDTYWTRTPDTEEPYYAFGIFDPYAQWQTVNSSYFFRPIFTLPSTALVDGYLALIEQ